MCFNRTFMELKWTWRDSMSVPSLRFNRTFMELKCAFRAVADGKMTVLIVPLWNWNDNAINTPNLSILVLIVPLWNWNKIRMPIIKCSTMSFNRTFMELKWWEINVVSIVMIGFNRTFMELKLPCELCTATRCRVLIVPLWNWNVCFLI